MSASEYFRIEDIKGITNKTKAVVKISGNFPFRVGSRLSCVRLLTLVWKTHISRTLTFSIPRSKGKGIPLQAWTSPEDSRRLRHPDFKTIGT